MSNCCLWLDRVESIEAINQMAIVETMHPTAPRISLRRSPRSSIFDGYFSASTSKPHTAGLPPVYNDTHDDMEKQRLHEFDPPMLRREDIADVSEDIRTIYATLSADRTIPLSLDGLISAYSGSGLLSLAATPADPALVDVMVATLDSTLWFLQHTPKGILQIRESASYRRRSRSFHSRLADMDDPPSRDETVSTTDMSFCSLVCSAGAPLMQSDNLTGKLLYFLLELSQDDVVRSGMGPCVSSGIGPCEITQRALAVHGTSSAPITEMGLLLICRLCCQHLSSSSSGSGVEATGRCREYFRSPLVVRSLLEAVSVWVTRAMVSELACKTISCLAHNEASRSSLVEAGALTVLERIVELHGACSEAVVEWACRTIYSVMTEHPDNRKATQDTALCSLLVGAGLSNTVLHSSDIIRWGCRAVSNMSYECEEVQRVFVRLGACQAVVRILEVEGLGDADIAMSACWALSNIVTCQERDQTGVVDCDGVSAVLMVVRIHTRSVEVLREGCLCLAHLFRDDMGVGENILDKSDVVDVLLKRLAELEVKKKKRKEHPYVPEMVPVVWFGLTALAALAVGRVQLIKHQFGEVLSTSLRSVTDARAVRWMLRCVNCFAAENDADFTLLSSLGVCEYVAAALKKSLQYPPAVYEGCLAIGRLATDVENRQSLGAHKACEIIAQVLYTYEQDVRIVGAALLAVVNLCAENEKNSNKLVICGVCKVIPRAMIFHQCGDVALTLWGMKAVTMLADMREGPHKLASHGACRVLGMAFNTHINNITILKNVCLAASKLALHGKIREILHSFGACEILVNIAIIALQQVKEESVVSACLEAIEHMLLDTDLLGLFGALGTSEIAVNIVEAYPHSALLTHLCWSIVNKLIAYSDCNRNRLEKSNACARLQDALTVHEKNYAVVCVACSTICTLLHCGASPAERNGTAPRVHRQSVLPPAVEAVYFRLCELHMAQTLCHILELHLQCDIGEDALCQCLAAIGWLAETHAILHGQGDISGRYRSYKDSNSAAAALSTVRLECESGEGEKEVQLSAVTALCSCNVCDHLVAILNLYCGDDDDVMEVSLLTCSLLAETNAECKARLGQSGACEVIHRVLSVNDHCGHRSELIHYLAIKMVSVISAECFNNAVRLLALGVIGHMVRIADMHRNSDRIAWVLCLAVGHLSRGHNMTNLIIYQTVGTVMQRFLRSERVCIAACDSLAEIDVSMDVAASSFLSTAQLLCRVVVGSLTKHISSPALCKSAAQALSVIALLYHSEESPSHNETRIDRDSGARGELLRALSSTGVCKYLVYIYLRHSSDASVMYSTSQAVCNITLPSMGEDRDAICDLLERFRDMGVCNAIMASLKIHADNACVLATSLQAMINLAENPYNRTQLGGNANCLFVVNIMHMHQQNSTVTAAACHLIQVLSDRNRKNSLFLADSGACECIVWAMDTFPSHVGIARYGCGAIGCMAEKDDDLRQRFGDSRACDIICATVFRHLGDEIVAATGCVAMGSLAEKNDANVERLGSLDACGIVLSAMSRHSDSIRVGCAGCQALTFLSAFVQAKADTVGKVSVSMVRQAVTQVAARWAGDDMIALWSSRALNAMYVQDGRDRLDGTMSAELENRTFEVVRQSLISHMRSKVDIVEENILTIANMLSLDIVKYPAEDICEHLHTALLLYADNSGIFVGCCKAAVALKSRVEDLLACRFPQSLLDILRKHSTNDLVVQWGCEAIAGMAGDGKVRDALVACGACETVIRALQRGTGSDALVAVVLQKSIGNQALGLAACRAVHSLGYNSDAYVERLGANGACEGVAKVLLKYADNEDVAATGCQAIVTLAQRNYTNKSKLGSAGACKSIRVALDAHRATDTVAIWACRAVEALVDGHDSNTVRMGADGVCDAVVMAMQAHQAVPEVAGAGCGAVAGLCLHHKNITKLRLAGVCENVLFSIHLCFFDLGTVEKACVAISRLAEDVDNCKELLAADVSTALMCIVCRHSHDATVTEAVWRAVRCMSAHNVDAARCFGDAGFCPVIAANIQDIAEDTKTTRRGVIIECLQTMVVLIEVGLGNCFQKFLAEGWAKSVLQLEQLYAEDRHVTDQVGAVKILFDRFSAAAAARPGADDSNRN